MKRFWTLFFTLLLAVLTAAEEKSIWLSDFEKAKAEAGKKTAPLLIIVYGPDWNAQSQRLNKEVIRDKSFTDFLKRNNIVPLLVKLPSSQPDEETRELLKNFPGYSSVPHCLIMDGEGKVLERRCRASKKILTQRLLECKRILDAAAAKKKAEEERKQEKENRKLSREERRKIREERNSSKKKEKDKKKDKKKDKDRKKSEDADADADEE